MDSISLYSPSGDHVTLTTQLTCCASTIRMVGWGISQWGPDVNQSESKLCVCDFKNKQTTTFLTHGYILPHLLSSLTFCVPSPSKLDINWVFWMKILLWGFTEVVLRCSTLFLNVGKCQSGMLADLTDGIWVNLTDPLFTCSDTHTR